MTGTQGLLLLIPVAYLVGSIPFGLLVGRAHGIDPRAAGSGNIGATNVGRLLGRRAFAIVFTLDFLKGLLPAAAATWLVHRAPEPTRGLFALWLGVGFAAVCGHLFSLYLRFRGGKGIATTAGVALGIFPYFTFPMLLAVGVWGAVFFLWRIVSLASVIGAAAFPLAYVGVGLARGWPIAGAQLPLLAFCVIVAALVIYKHRANLARLRAGAEPRVAARP